MYTISLILGPTPDKKDVFVGCYKDKDNGIPKHPTAIKIATHNHIYDVENEKLKIPITDDLKKTLPPEMKIKDDYLNLLEITRDKYDKFIGNKHADKFTLEWDVTENQYNKFFK